MEDRLMRRHRRSFGRQLEGYGLTTAQILYRLPDHPALLQTYVWQDYDLCPKFPVLNKFLGVLAPARWKGRCIRSRSRMPA